MQLRLPNVDAAPIKGPVIMYGDDAWEVIGGWVVAFRDNKIYNGYFVRSQIVLQNFVGS